MGDKERELARNLLGFTTSLGLGSWGNDIQQRILPNREKARAFLLDRIVEEEAECERLNPSKKMDEVLPRSFKQAKDIVLKKPPLEEYEHPALDILNEWYHYFDEGYVSKYNIDDLPRLIEESLSDMAVNG